MLMIHTFWLALAISVLFMRSLLTVRLGLLKTTSSSTLIKPANLLSIDAGLVLLLLWIPFLPGATRVTIMRVLGVVLSANLTMGNHLDEILSSSASSIHALRMLRSHVLGSPQLHVIARSTTLASMLYASPAWWGFTSARDKDRLEKLEKLQRGGFLPNDGLSFADLA